MTEYVMTGGRTDPIQRQSDIGELVVIWNVVSKSGPISYDLGRYFTGFSRDGQCGSHGLT